MAVIPPDQLRQLYQSDMKTDTQIAEQFGMHQPAVSALRKRYGIPTIGRNARLQLPPLTPTQQSLLIGSMLGDGQLLGTGSCSAAYQEFHCSAQKDYLEWKVGLWSPHNQSVAPVKKGEHTGFVFRSYASSHLFPYWKQFYPKGKGSKVFGDLDPSLVDPFALAIWYLDDGSVGDSCFRFSVGPDPSSVKTQMRVLQGFGLHPTYLAFKGDHSISIRGAGNIQRFLDLITPHVPPCMAYKLVSKVTRKRGIPPRERLTEVKLRDLYARGYTAVQVAKAFTIGATTVHRFSRQWGLQALDFRRLKKETLSEPVLDTILKDERDPLKAFAYLSRTTLPLRVLAAEKLAKDVLALRNCRTTFQQGVLTDVSPCGTALCNTFFPYRAEARYRGGPSLSEGWADPGLLQKAIQFQIRVGDPLTPYRVMRALQVILRAPTNFKPSVAQAIIKAYCPEGGLVLDPSAGYGGRACGALSSGRSYIGVEPHSKAPEAFARLHSALGGDFRLISAPYEDADLDGISADLVFTSPPYFSVEHYSPDPSQSWVRYPSWDLWVQGFVVPFVGKSWDHLKAGGYFVVNTKTVKMGNKVYPIDLEVELLARKIGFDLVARYGLSLGKVGKTAKVEPLLVFRKP